MALDRLGELVGPAGKNNDFAVNAKDEEAQDEDYETDDQNMVQFWNQIRYCQTSLKTVRRNMERQSEIKIAYKTSTQGDTESNLQNEFDTLTTVNDGLFKEVCKKVKYLQEQYKKCAEEFPDEPETRMKEGQVVSISTQVSNQMRDCQELSLNFKQEIKGKLKRQVEHAQDDHNKMSDKQVNDMIESNPQAVKQMLEQKLVGMPHMKVKNAVLDIEEKCKEIELLSKNIRQLYELIQEISEIVTQQGRQVDLIYNNVSKARDYVDKGNKNLGKAKEYHQAARKKQCCIILLAVIVLVVLLLPVVASLF